MPLPHRRTRYSHAALAVIALLSAVLLGNVQSSRCEIHGLGATLGHATGAMAGHDMMAGMSHDAGGNTHDMGGCDCSCIGDCSTVAPLAAAPHGVTVRVAVVAPATRRALDREPARAPAPEPDRLLPFANGPPAPALS